MTKKTVRPLLGTILQKIAPRIGAKVVMEPTWQIAGQIIFKNGRKRYFRYSSLDVNPLGASEIAKDKDYASFFMKRMGYPVIRGQTFFSNSWAKAIGSNENIHAAWHYAQTLGLPVYVKPNSGSQGSGVCLVYNKQEFYRAFRQVFAQDRVGIVQRPVSGRDYRVVVLDGRIISAYERIPLNVIGDGRSTILQLLKKKQDMFVTQGRDTRINFRDPRIKEKLNGQGRTLPEVLTAGQRVYLLDNANLSTGGDSVDVTNQMHPGFKKLAIQLTKDMGLRMCGVDMIIVGEITKKPKKYWILEVNSAPGLDHYAQTGQAQKKIVEDLYLAVLKSMQ